MNVVFIGFTFRYIGDKTFPDTGAFQAYKQRMRIGIPIVKISNYRNIGSIRSPHRKIVTGFTQNLTLMSTEVIVQPVMCTPLKIINILLGKQ
jgi:hypothetical protein